MTKRKSQRGRDTEMKTFTENAARGQAEVNTSKREQHLYFLQRHYAFVSSTDGSVDFGELTAANLLVDGQSGQGRVLVGRFVRYRELHGAPSNGADM